MLWLEFDGDNEGTPVNKLLKIYSKQVGVGAARIPVGVGMERVDLGAPRLLEVSAWLAKR